MLKTTSVVSFRVESVDLTENSEAKVVLRLFWKLAEFGRAFGVMAKVCQRVTSARRRVAQVKTFFDQYKRKAD